MRERSRKNRSQARFGAADGCQLGDRCDGRSRRCARRDLHHAACGRWRRLWQGDEDREGPDRGHSEAVTSVAYSRPDRFHMVAPDAEVLRDRRDELYGTGWQLHADYRARSRSAKIGGFANVVRVVAPGGSLQPSSRPTSAVWRSVGVRKTVGGVSTVKHLQVPAFDRRAISPSKPMTCGSAKRTVASTGVSATPGTTRWSPRRRSPSISSTTPSRPSSRQPARLPENPLFLIPQRG